MQNNLVLFVSNLNNLNTLCYFEQIAQNKLVVYGANPKLATYPKGYFYKDGYIYYSGANEQKAANKIYEVICR